MRRALILLLVGLATAVAESRTVDHTLAPHQLRPGMTGYGMSVFRGTEPERFAVEIIGVLPNALPKQDMILVRMSGANLEQHKIIAGMSGSPVYINDKMIGAVAYGWTFENEPLAGVTPIHNMLAEIDQPPPRPAARQQPARPGMASVGLASRPGLIPPLEQELAAPQRLLTPLSVGGFSPEIITHFAATFHDFGLIPVSAGGSAVDPARRPVGKIVPGSALGIELVRGDLNAVGVGTATYVKGDRVLGFGHPFLLGGEVVAPAVQAKVHTVMSSLARSFKLASAVAQVGAMIGDWQSCIVTDSKATASMIPVDVTAHGLDTDRSDRFRLEIIDNQMLSPVFAQMTLAQVIRNIVASTQDTMLEFDLEITLADRTVTLANTHYLPQGGRIPAGVLRQLGALFSTPFGHPPIRNIRATVTTRQARHTATILGAYFGQADARPGETVTLNVLLKPFDAPQRILKLPVTIPSSTGSLQQLTVAVVSGTQAPIDAAKPDSLATYLDAIEKQQRSTDLVAIIRQPTEGLQVRGHLLKNLPASARSVLDGQRIANVVRTPDLVHVVEPTDWVLSGHGMAQIKIKKRGEN